MLTHAILLVLIESPILIVKLKLHIAFRAVTGII